MSGNFSLEGYIDVAERIALFNEKYPDGSLQTINWSVETIGEQLFIVYRAAAYRTPTDERPGHGTAWEPFPGTTPYTRNSELMNSETAAWGRAIVAVGLSANRKIASKQEVRARSEEQKVGPLISGALADALEKAFHELGWTQGEVRKQLVAHGAQDTTDPHAALRSLSQVQGERLWQSVEKAVQAKETA